MDMQKSLPAAAITISTKRYIIFGLLAGGLSLLLPILALGVILTTLTALFLAKKRFSFVEALGLSLLSLACLQIILYSLITIAGLHLPVRLALPLEALASVAAMAWFLRKQAQVQLSWHWFQRGDIMALLVSIAVGIVLLIPVVRANGGSIAQFLSYGEDNASHYALNRYISDEGTFGYQQKADDIGVLRSLEIYPQGFHVNAAVMGSLAYPASSSESGVVKLHALFITMQYAFFIFWLVKICFCRPQKTPWQLKAAAVPAVTLLVGLGVFMMMLARGFQPQIFAYTFLMAIVFIIGYSLSQQPKRPSLSAVYFCIFLCIGIAASWWLLLPVVGVMLLYAAHMQQLWRPLLADWRKHLPAKIIVVLAILYPIIINILLSQKHDPLIEPGGVDKLSWTIFWYLAPVVLAAYVLCYRTMRRHDYLVVGLVASILLALLIGVYHKLHVGHFEYYFYKSIYTVLIFSFALFVVGGLNLANTAYKRLGSYALLVPAAIVLVTLAVAYQSKMVYARVYANNWYPNAVQRGDMDLLFAANASDYDDVLFVGDCSPARDYLRNRWAGARFLSANPWRNEVEIATLNSEPARINANLATYATGDDDILVVAGSCTAPLDVLRTLDDPDVRIIEGANPTPQP